MAGFCDGCAELLILNSEHFCQQCEAMRDREFAEEKARKDMEEGERYAQEDHQVA